MSLMLIFSKFVGWLRLKISPFRNPINPNPTPTQQALKKQQLAIKIDEQISNLRNDLATDKKNCATLGQALHDAGLEGFAHTLPEIAQKYGYNFTAEDFKAHLNRQTNLRPAAYLVQYCRGGGLH
jgi:hypothetical protein